MAHDPLDDLDYYALLGLADDAGEDDVKSAFRKFARKYHPDRFAGEDDEKRERATVIFRRGSEALQVLTDPAQRAAYDRALQQGRTRLVEDGRSTQDRLAAVKDPPKPEPTAPAPASHPVKNERARAYFQRAVEAAKSQDWPLVRRALIAALEAEGESEFLRARLRQVDAMLQ